MDFETGYPIEGYSAGMRGGKIWGYENAHRVPFFIRWPKGGIKGGKDIDALTANIDLMPTLIDLCNLQTSENLGYDGKSFAELVKGKVSEWPERTIITHYQRVEFAQKDKEYQVMTEKWRLVKRDKDELYDIVSDPGQHHDIADQHPDVVKKLYQEYEKWWEENALAPDWYAEIYVGSEHENPATLYAHDSYRRDNKRVWVVKVDRDGTYEIKLNRWPEESGKRIIENGAGDKALPIVSASLIIGNLELEKEVTHDMTSADFTVELKAGTTCLHTSLNFAEEGKTARTDCVYVKYLRPSEQGVADNYKASDPDEVLRKDFAKNVESFN